MIGKEDNKYLLNVVFSALSFLLAPLALLLLRRPCIYYMLFAAMRSINSQWFQVQNPRRSDKGPLVLFHSMAGFLYTNVVSMLWYTHAVSARNEIDSCISQDIRFESEPRIQEHSKYIDELRNRRFLADGEKFGHNFGDKITTQCFSLWKESLPV